MYDAFMTCNVIKYGFRKKYENCPAYCGGPCIVLVRDVSVIDVLEYLVQNYTLYLYLMYLINCT